MAAVMSGGTGPEHVIGYGNFRLARIGTAAPPMGRAPRIPDGGSIRGGAPLPGIPDGSMAGERPQITGFWWYPGQFQALYMLKPQGHGNRITFSQGRFQFGQQNQPFAWSVKGNVLTRQYVSGYREVVRLSEYDSRTDSFSTDKGQWFGCRSGQMPNVMQSTFCGSRQ